MTVPGMLPSLRLKYRHPMVMLPPKTSAAACVQLEFAPAARTEANLPLATGENCPFW